MDSQQYDRLFDEDVASLLKDPPKHTLVDKKLSNMSSKKLAAGAVPVPPDRVKRIKAFIERKLALGYHLDHVKKIAAKKFNINVYDIPE